MPVLEHAASDQPNIVFLIRHLGGRLVGDREDDRLTVVTAVEFHTFSRLYIGIETFAVAPLGFLAIDDRPPKPTFLVIAVVGGQIMPVPSAEGGIFLEQALLDVETECLGLFVGVVGLDLAQGELIDLPVFEQDVVKGLAAKLRMTVEDFRGPDFVVVNRLENSTSCQRSERASPGASTSWCQTCVRRSAFP